jgi:DNA-directed RNA polymerase subunit L
MRPFSTFQSSAHPAHSHSISLRIHDITQLFNSMDPSPFIEKDLDEKAEVFIVGWAQEFPANAKIKLRVHLEQWPSEGDPKELIRQAVHNHFAHLTELNRLEFKALMKQGRTSLLIGLCCLVISLVSSKMLTHGEAGTWASILRESLTIAGWVAMWRPMQIYLYDWWPLRRRGRLYDKLSRMPVEVVQKGGRADEPPPGNTAAA